MRTTATVVILIICSSATLKSQEDSEKIAFRDVLKGLVAERQRPKLYEVKFKIFDQHLSKIRTNDTDEANLKEVGRRQETTGIIRFDEEAGCLYVDSQTVLLETLDADEFKSTEQLLRNTHPAKAVLVKGKSKWEYDPLSEIVRYKFSPPRIEDDIPIPFDIFGLCVAAEVSGIPTTFETVIKRLDSWFGKWEVPIDKNGIVTIDLRNEIYKIDTHRGYFPILHETLVSDIRNGKRIKVPLESQRMELIEVNKSWLPKKMELDKSTLSRVYDFEWLHWDEPLSRNAFEWDEIMKERWTKKKEKGESSTLQSGSLRK